MKTEVELLEKKWVKNIDKVIEIQEKGVDVFKKSSKVLFEYATGVGKSKQAIDCIEESITVSNEKWLLVCWETAHIENWKKEFSEWGKTNLLKNIDIICYASLSNYFEANNFKTNMICDETHHAFSPTYWPLVRYYHNKLIMLTATLPSDSRMILRKEIPEIKRVAYTLSSAIADGVLPEPAIFKVPIGFDNSTRSEILELKKGAKAAIERTPCVELEYGKHWSILKNQQIYNMKVRCTPQEKLDFMNKNIEFLKQRFFTIREDWVKNQWVQAGSKRKKFIAEMKTKFAKKLILSLGDKRMIVFCGSIDQAIELGKENSVHSKNTEKQNRERIERFQSGLSNKLFTNKMLTEGMNLSGIEVAILIQLDNKNLTFIQKAGRAMRAEFPLLFILVVPNSQDEKYFITSTQGMDRNYIKDYYDYESDLF